MKILGITSRQSGCGYHRIVMPLAFMDDIYGHITNGIHEEIANEKFDIALFNRICYAYDNDLDKLRANHGCKIVMDIDDDWDLPANHILKKGYDTIKLRIEANLRESDMVICTNTRLADKIYKFNKSVSIIPNAIPYGQHQFIDDKVLDDKIRLFWCGSITHEPDIKLLHNPIKRLHTHKDKIKMVLGGYYGYNAVDKKIWDRMFSYYTDGGQLPNIKLEGMLPEHYMELYEYADVCLIPLENSFWHQCKSNIKVLEAAAKKCAVIVSSVEPYSRDADMPVLWVNKSADWFTNINLLINNKELIKEYGETLYEWAKTKYDFNRINQGRKTAFENIIKS
jgi:glycosyltransferase involved in cell wall biosynthesis